jgi:D-glycero-D-manno-heptose 1,7-bisphosphate phosphatase
MTPSQQAAVFLDRDGVLNRTVVRGGVTHPPAHLGELEMLPGVPEALHRLAGSSFVLVVVTNQPDVARGAQLRERVEEINDHLRATLPIRDVLTCYHDSADACVCRKPQPGLLQQGARRWRLDVGRSFMVGDRWSDVVAGQAAGCRRSLLVETPYSGRERCAPDACVPDLPAAADWIIRFVSGGKNA